MSLSLTASAYRWNLRPCFSLCFGGGKVLFPGLTQIEPCALSQGRKRALESAWILAVIRDGAALFIRSLDAAFNLYSLFFLIIQKHIGESHWLSILGHLKLVVNSR